MTGPSDGPVMAVTSEIAISSLKRRAFAFASRLLADERELELRYL